MMNKINALSTADPDQILSELFCLLAERGRKLRLARQQADTSEVKTAENPPAGK